MLLLLILVVGALGAVTSQHQARKLFQALEGEQAVSYTHLTLPTIYSV